MSRSHASNHCLCGAFTDISTNSLVTPPFKRWSSSSLPLSVGWTWWLISNEQSKVKEKLYNFVHHSKAQWLLSWLLCLLDHSLRGRLTAMFWAALWRSLPPPTGVWRTQAPSPVAGVKLNPLNSNMRMTLGVEPSAPVQPQNDSRAFPTPNSLTETSWKALSQNHPAKASSWSLPLDCMTINVCCTLLSFGLIFMQQ